MKKILAYTHLISMLAAIFSLVSCSEEVEPKPLTYSQQLAGTSSKSWRLTGFQLVEGDNQPVNIDLREVLSPCELDDLYVFYNDKDRKYEILEGATKCNAADPDVFFTDSWSIINATATVNFILPLFASGTFTLKSLTETTMTVEYYFKEDNYSYRFTLTSQRN